MSDDYRRLAEADGATFTQDGKRSGLDPWRARDRDGVTIVSGALSIAEAARLYCEDKDLTPDGEALI